MRYSLRDINITVCEQMVAQLVIAFHTFYVKPEGSLLCQCPVAGPYPKPVESSSQPSNGVSWRSI